MSNDEELQGKSPKELLALWQEARDERIRFAEELGFVFKDVNDKPIETPPRALTPKTAKELQRLEQREDELWRAYRKASHSPE